MDLGSHTVLVTGGGTGIGLALATRFLTAGSRVIACGRREGMLRAAAAAHPGLVTRVCDVAREDERMALVEWLLTEHPALDVLVNNAGIQRRFKLEDPAPWEETHQEIAINLHAPIHLTLALLPHLRERKGAIVNVTSGLSFVPLVEAPVYCATKAALHSFTLSLRRQLADSGVRVLEIIPPSVNTDLGGPGLHDTGAPVADFADEVMARLAAGEEEIAYGDARRSAEAAHAAFDDMFARMNG